MKRVVFFIAVEMLLLLGCSRHGTTEAQRSAVDEAVTAIDSLYVSMMHANGREEAIPRANALLYRLHSEQVTDSLLQYNMEAAPDSIIATANYWMGEYLLAEERYREALAAANNALSTAVTLENQNLQWQTHSLISVIYFRMGLLEDAIDNLTFCFEADMKNDDKEGMSSDLNNLAAMSLQAKQYDNAKDYIDRAIRIERPLNRRDVLAIRLGIASETYMLLGRLAEAEGFAREAYRLDSEDGRECKAAIRLSQLASVLIKSDKKEEALKTLRDAAPRLKECGNDYSYTVVMCQLGDLAIEGGDNAEAAADFREALAISEREGTMYLQQRALKGLWQSLKGSDVPRAAAYLEQYATVTDSIYSGMTSTRMAEMQSTFRQKELELEQECLKAEVRARDVLSVSALVLAALLAILLCYIFYSRHRLQNMQRSMETQSSDFLSKLAAEHNRRRELANGGATDDADTDADDAEMSTADRRFLTDLVEKVYTRLDNGEPTDIDTLAHVMGMGRSGFTKKVQALTGNTTMLYINKIKISKAKAMMDSDSSLQISDVAYACGFEDPNYFSRLFKQLEGTTPTSHQRREK